jgi:hypothetical protein
MTAKKYTPIEAANLREQMIREDVVPMIRRAFEAYPALQSATLLVAQFWCDEAHDAVHCDVVFSELNTPDIQAAYRARRQRYEVDDAPPPRSSRPSGWRAWFPWLGGSKNAPPAPEVQPKGDITNLPSILDDEKLEDEFTFQLNWDSNGAPISLFAAFCLEDCHQEMDEGEAYTPYAIMRRQHGDVAVEVVGVMAQPWLDGVVPEGDE